MNELPASDTPRPAITRLQLLVRGIRLQAEGILAFELEDPDGADLPEVTAGAHVDVHLPNGQVRSYSLAGDPFDRSHWMLGVLRDTKGRGGSLSLHEQVRVGDLLTIGAPRNAFALKSSADHAILLAGGIGITPLKAMAHVLCAEGRSFELHYCARGLRQAAFVDELRGFIPEDRLHLHFDGGDPSRGLDVAALLAGDQPGRQIYYCGPAGFMKACAAASAHWAPGTVHSEHFKVPEPKPIAADAVEGVFEVRLARSGTVIQVTAEQTIVRALELAGHRVPTSCLAGICGACKVHYLEGEVDHQDYILSDEEKATCLTLCCSRAKSATLVLDL